MKKSLITLVFLSPFLLAYLTPFGGGGGGGITSINGNSNAAQTIAAGSGISVVSGGGTTTITNTASSSIIIPSVLVTTDGSPHTVYSFPVTNNTAYLLDANCVARRTDAADRAMFEKKAGVYQEGGGGAVQQGASNSIFSESSDATWSLTWVMSAGNAVLTAQGAVGKTIDWTCTISYQQGN